MRRAERRKRHVRARKRSYDPKQHSRALPLTEVEGMNTLTHINNTVKYFFESLPKLYIIMSRRS